MIFAYLTKSKVISYVHIVRGKFLSRPDAFSKMSCKKVEKALSYVKHEYTLDCFCNTSGETVFGGKMAKKISKKLIIIITSAVVVVGLAVGIPVGLHFGSMKVNPDTFKAQISDSGIFKNTLADAIPQTDLYDIINKHMTQNTSGKVPKLLFIGYDGCIANALTFIENKDGSAIFKTAKTGGLYLSYAGGAKVGDQDTSTAPGWASIFTGKWASEHGVFDNNDTLKKSTESLIYSFGKAQINTGFCISWSSHFTVTYKDEKAAAEAAGYPITYSKSDGDDGVYNATRAMLQGTDKQAIFSILEATDSAGHTKGFTVKNKTYLPALNKLEGYANTLISDMESRPTYAQEDWLVVITTDHGGHKLNHGGTTPMESTTWVAINKPIA